MTSKTRITLTRRWILFPFKRMAAAAAGIALAGGAALAVAAPAGAATYTDTSLQANTPSGYSINPSAITGTVSGKVLTFAATGSETLAAPAISGGTGGDLTTAGSTSTAVTLTGSATTATSPYALTFKISSGTGSTDVETVTGITEVTGTPGPASAPGTITDAISTITTHNNNVTGAVDFGITGTTSALNSVTEGNLPSGLVSGNPLVPGTAIPGTYNGVTVAATDAAGSALSGHFGLKVNATQAVVHKSYGPGAISNFYSAKCLDTAYRWFNGGGLVQWTCGSSGGINQQFELVYSGSGYELQAIAPSGKPAGPWCVTTDKVTGDQLTLQTCATAGTTPPAGQEITKSGPYYKFTGTAQVINDPGYQTYNSAWVIGWPLVPGAANEKYTLP